MYAIQTLFYIFCRSYRTYLCMGLNGKARCRFGNIIRMAHPADGLLGNAAKHFSACIHIYFRFSVLTDRSRGNLSSKCIHHQLGTIADSQHWNAQFKYFLRALGRLFAIYAAWPSRKNNSLWIHFLDLVHAYIIRMNLTIHIAFPYPSGNQLIVLSAKIQYDNHLLFHSFLLFHITWFVFL